MTRQKTRVDRTGIKGRHRRGNSVFARYRTVHALLLSRQPRIRRRARARRRVYAVELILHTGFVRLRTGTLRPAPLSWALNGRDAGA
jgi:hypothetical protein